MVEPAVVGAWVDISKDLKTRAQVLDYLILGGGSAGCVLAARLSENPKTSVMLIEAGRNISANDMPKIIRTRYPGRAFLDENFIWPSLTARFGPPDKNGNLAEPRRYEQGRALGGGSAVNALVANRGAPGDYDEWSERGARGWSWETVLPYFRKLESDHDYADEFHGQDGPIPIRRITQPKMSPFVKLLCATLKARGYPTKPDQNGMWEDGIYIGAIAKDENGHRVPTSTAYLTNDVRTRPNLRIITDHLAERITFDGTKTTGAIVRPAVGSESLQKIQANEIILSCGAIHTPALLMRSGVGPSDQPAFNIPVVAQLAGVGRNLMDHPSTAVSTYLPPALRQTDLEEHHDHAILRFSSGLAGTPEGDMHLAMIARSGWHSIGRRIGTLFIWLNKPYSRGNLSLASTRADDEPIVDFKLLSDERDLERLKKAFILGTEILTDPLLDRHCGPAFPTSYSTRVMKVSGPGLFNQTRRGMLATMLDHAGLARSWLIRSVITNGLEIKLLVQDEDALTEFIRTSVGGVWHASGTCRMGSRDDPNAVTDSTGRVYKVGGLRVCDASLMPSIPRANTNIPTIMMAEKIADFIKEGG